MQTNCHMAKLIQTQAAHYGERTALSYRNDHLKRWVPISWNKFSTTVLKVSNALLHLGVGVQENLAIFSQNMPECLFVDFGAYGIRAVTIPFYATSSEQQVRYMVNDAGVRFIFVGEQEQYETALRTLPLCPTLERLIIFSRKVKRHAADTVSLYFDEFLDWGTAYPFHEEVERRTAAATFGDVANILYTSGTTGDSKGVLLTHGMYHEAFRVNSERLPLGEKDVLLNFLPFTHVFERGWAYLALTVGAHLAINLRPNDVLQSLREVHPTCMSSVPRFWEKVYHAVMDRIGHSNQVERRLMLEAFAIGKRYNIGYLSKGLTPPLSLRLRYKFYERTLLRQLRRTLGLERANFFPTAGAAVPTEVEEFVHSVGLNMVVGYGLTESTATVSCDVPGRPYTIGSVGRVVSHLEIKIADNNEILLRGKTITPGYYHRETATAQAIDAEGWFHTGDAGYLRGGELFLTDRIKDLFKTSNGKYIAPQMIESKLVVDRYIDQVVVVADRHKFVSALIIPDYRLLEQYAAEHHIAYNTRAELCANEQINQMIRERIDTLQQEFAHYEKVKQFRLLPAPFSLERGELTNTLKVKRPVVYRHFAALIESMYNVPAPSEQTGGHVGENS